MENVKIAEVCGLCAGCTFAINSALEELDTGNNVTIFKEIVHNKNVNSFLESKGARFETDINNLNTDSVVIIRAHGEPPETYEHFEKHGYVYKDCTCWNVKKIHEQVKKFREKGYKIIIIGKHNGVMHPEVFATLGWAGNDAILIESEDEIQAIENSNSDKFYLVCQTTFNIQKAEDFISKIESLTLEKGGELVINKSLCGAQKRINESSENLAKESDVMIVVGGLNSSNSKELFNNVKNFVPSVFIEDIRLYKEALETAGIKITRDTKIGITAGASTRKEELFELKDMIEKDIESK